MHCANVRWNWLILKKGIFHWRIISIPHISISMKLIYRINVLGYFLNTGILIIIVFTLCWLRIQCILILMQINFISTNLAFKAFFKKSNAYFSANTCTDCTPIIWAADRGPDYNDKNDQGFSQGRAFLLFKNRIFFGGGLSPTRLICVHIVKKKIKITGRGLTKPHLPDPPMVKKGGKIHKFLL